MKIIAALIFHQLQLISHKKHQALYASNFLSKYMLIIKKIREWSHINK